MFTLTLRLCNSCGYDSHARWLKKHLLDTFDCRVVEEDASHTPGTFVLLLNGQVVFSKDAAGRFPEEQDVDALLRSKGVPLRPKARL